MNIRTFYSSSLLFFFLIVSGCDSTTSPVNKLLDAPTVERLTLVPQNVQFIPSDGFTDTTLTVKIETQITNADTELTQGYIVRDKDGSTVLFQGELTRISKSFFYSAEIAIETSTTSFLEYVVEVYAYNEDGNGNYFQANFGVEGFSNNPPEILEVNNPDTVTRPSSGEELAFFTAKVRDQDGQSSIDRVLMRIIDLEVGEPSESPFQLFDDGSTFNDVTENDSVFTFSLPITPTTNRPNRDFNLEYFAIDKGGLISDTVRTTFSIRD